MKEGLFVTEASQNVGFGHLMECIAIAEQCRGFSNISFCLYNSDNRAAGILAGKELPSFGRDRAIEDIALDRDYDWIFMNTRNNSFSHQNSLVTRTGNFIVLDELGNIKVNCHSLINFSINDQWHKYDYEGKAPRLFLGPDYYPVRDSLIRARESRAQIDGSVLVTLGGADRTNTTLRLANILRELKGTPVTYVIGPGSGLTEDDLGPVLRDAPAQKVVKAPRNFEELMAAHQFIVSSGGNTLYEAAFLGKSTLIVWEDTHEKVQGELFEQKGRARIVGGPYRIDRDLIMKLVTDSRTTDKQKTGGPAMVDGRGLNRITSIIQGAA